VTRYATDVVAGAIIAARLVRLACQRHLNDLRDAAAKGLLWKPAEAQEAIDFFPEVLCLPEETDADEDVEAADDVRPEQGTPFVLTPFQQFIVGSLFGWFAVRVSKKTGRPARAAAVPDRLFRRREGLRQDTDGRRDPAVDAGAARRPRRAVVLRRGDERAGEDRVRRLRQDGRGVAGAAVSSSRSLGNNLSVKTTGSFIRPISAEKRGLDGKRVQGAVVDELHEHPSSTVVVKLRAGIKGRPNALIFIPTNSGFDRETVCWEYHDYSRQILEGTLVNEAWFAFVCHLDACDRCQREREAAAVRRLSGL
jgi:phage terminase large subunit-like protein